jgi:hypothetical protein
MVYVILGMHKSGTTLVAQTLHHSGINMGADLSEDDLDYGSEKSESRQARLINSQILDSVGKFSLDVVPTFEPELNPEAEAQLRNFVTQQSQKYTKWGFKDPRTTLTYPVWKPLLGEHKLILVYRPMEYVWRHYTRGLLRGFKPLSFKSLRKGVQSINAWVGYNAKLVALIEAGAEGTYLLNYDLMMTDASVLEGLGRFTETELIDVRRGQALPLTGRERLVFSIHRFIYQLRFGGASLRRVNQGLACCHMQTQSSGLA